ERLSSYQILNHAGKELAILLADRMIRLVIGEDVFGDDSCVASARPSFQVHAHGSEPRQRGAEARLVLLDVARLRGARGRRAKHDGGAVHLLPRSAHFDVGEIAALGRVGVRLFFDRIVGKGRLLLRRGKSVHVLQGFEHLSHGKLPSSRSSGLQATSRLGSAAVSESDAATSKPRRVSASTAASASTRRSSAACASSSAWCAVWLSKRGMPPLPRTKSSRAASSKSCSGRPPATRTWCSR